MEGLLERARARSYRYGREFLTGKPAFIQEFANWTLDNGCTHAITITPDIRPGGSFNAERELRPIMKRLAKVIAHDVRGVPLRQLHLQTAIDRTVWMAGFVELLDKSGNPYPHFHGAVALRRGEHALMANALATRWGKGRGIPALRPVFRRYGSHPDFDLTTFTDAHRWMSYSGKQTSLATATTWTHADLLGG